MDKSIMHSHSLHWLQFKVCLINLIFDCIFQKKLKDVAIFSNLLIQYWDTNVAAVAQHFANSCPEGHDKIRAIPG